MRVRSCFLGLAAAASLFAADDAPSWLKEFATTKVPEYPPKVAAVVLWNEVSIAVDDSGKVTSTVRKAVKILNREGRRYAIGGVSYETGSGKVRDIRGWMIRPSGEVKKFGKERVVDVALVGEAFDVYSELRSRDIVAEDDADPGAVFGYEATTEERSVFTQFEHNFQSNLPVLVSRFSLTLPAGWRPEAVLFNGKSEMQSSGATSTWEFRNLPYIEEEPWGPSRSGLAPRIAVSYIPSENAKAIAGRVFTSGWPDVSRWLAELEDPQATPNSDIVEKVQALTAGAATEIDRIRAIAQYVQTIKYVSIQIGIGRGGGYKPHSAADVFRKQYGDCKDKANLMRAMLKAANIPSHMVSIYSGDPTYVRENWPSPQQFNHAIIAVKVSDATSLPTVVEVPKLGRLMFFDPTDDSTPFGDLPEHEQGSFALVDDASSGTLVKMPVIPQESNRVERTTEAVLAPDGSITAVFDEKAFGQRAAQIRGVAKAQTKLDFSKGVERWVAIASSGAKVSKVDTADAFKEGRFNLHIEFAAPRYAQLMRGRLLVFRPGLLPLTNSFVFREEKRQNPVLLKASSFVETATIKLPAGFKVDELPDNGKLETPFGNFSISYTQKGGELQLTRKLEIRQATIPVEQYKALKTFCEQIVGAEQTPVVLAKE